MVFLLLFLFFVIFKMCPYNSKGKYTIKWKVQCNILSNKRRLQHRSTREIRTQDYGFLDLQIHLKGALGSLK